MPYKLQLLYRVAALSIIFSTWMFGTTTTALGQVTITRTSSPVFYIDTATSPALTGAYTSYQITTSSQSDVWVEITGFTGGSISLASTEDGIVQLGAFTSLETKTAFFYLEATSTSATAQSHTVNVYDGPPSSGTLLATQNFSLTTVEETIKANANKVTTVVSGPNPPTLGGIVTITVTGQTGTIGAAGILAFSPATYTDWPADAYQMIGSEVTLSGGNTTTITDALYHVAANSSNTDYVAVYTFKAVGTTTTPTNVSPVAYISSGTQIKHTDTSGFAAFDPVDSVNNQTILTKSAGTTTLSEGGVVTYTITLTNNGSVATELDDIVDTLPTSPAATTYVTNTAMYEGAAVEPTITGNTLTWQGPFAVPAGGTTRLTYDVTIPDIDGAYLNAAIGHIGSDQIDTTTDTSDPAPAVAVVDLDGALPVELTSFDAVLDGTTVHLAWTTASETNNAGFELQRRQTDHTDWNALSWIDGHGTTEVEQSYQFQITDLEPGRHTFRLKQIDYDGTFEYSPEVEVIVEMAERFLMEAAYPNPFNPEATFRFAVSRAQTVEVALFDLLGRRVQVLWHGEAEAGRMEAVRIDGSGLPSGMYLVRAVGNGFAETQRVTLIK